MATKSGAPCVASGSGTWLCTEATGPTYLIGNTGTSEVVHLSAERGARHHGPSLSHLWANPAHPPLMASTQGKVFMPREIQWLPGVSQLSH